MADIDEAPVCAAFAPRTGRAINTETPGCLVAFGGWLILLLPVWAPLVAALFGVS